mmetsp:Transcript_68600/g.165924  ORF Transcript_68600/g.165924 Transcript_68600/m.165924 type:complete len:350 (+) Transcript_68600:65-1114(+)
MGRLIRRPWRSANAILLLLCCALPLLPLGPSLLSTHPGQRTAGVPRHATAGSEAAVKERAASLQAEEEGASFGDRDPMLQLASALLPGEEQRAVSALYAWCRRADEICDAPVPERSAAERIELLEQLGEDFKRLRSGGEPTSRIDSELMHVLEKWPALGDRPFLDMLAGMRAELSTPRFATFDPELRQYAYCVAGTVGLMLLPVLGVPEPAAEVKSSAIDLGVAVQLTNILRDVGFDAKQGRIYLPQEDLKRFDVGEEDILEQRLTPAYCKLVSFETDRARDLLQSARGALPALPRRSQLVVLAVIQFMSALLDELLQRGCDNFSGKVRISTFKKVTCVVTAIWEWAWL